MPEVRVTCITKPNPQSPHEHITHLGGNGWYWTREQVIQSIDDRTNTFYVVDGGGNKAYVGVVRPDGGRAPWLQTYADGRWTNNLLSLPQCV